ncbi:MAG: radical SAM protein [Candidatus Omnitrophota bacterium]
MKSEYMAIKNQTNLPRIPLEASIDLTYRCNNNCRHCWNRIPGNSKKEKEELSLEEIKNIASEARSLGTRKWLISGGEPMLRQDFIDIFDYLTSHSKSFHLNTNGTLITPKIAKVFKKRRGAIMVALYGGDKKVHDHITRNPGSFEQALRGFRYLKEEGVRFIVQLIPMKDNFHQIDKMKELAKSLSDVYRIGASWLFGSGCAERNKEIFKQRLPAEVVVDLDKPDMSYDNNGFDPEEEVKKEESCSINTKGIFSSCIDMRRNFHIDPCGKMSFCSFVIGPELRYDLKSGTLKDAWENFIPSLKNKLTATERYQKTCGSCELRGDCKTCPAYSYLEHKNYSGKIGYLCDAAKETKKYKDNWKKNHRRFYEIADISIQVDSDLPITDKTFASKFKEFEIKSPEKDIVKIRHHFGIPDITKKVLGEEVYRKAPWAIYKKKNSWIYLGISPIEDDKHLDRIAVFNKEHTRLRVYNTKSNKLLNNCSTSLTFFPNDQIMISRALADRNGCYFHSSGVDFEGKGLLFIGHAEAGKTTMAKLLEEKGADILCDERVIARKKNGQFRIYGTWDHSDWNKVLNKSAPLKGIFFLEKSKHNYLEKVKNKQIIIKKLLSRVVRPFVDKEWWDKIVSIIEALSNEVPCYFVYFDKTGRIAEVLRKLK